MAGAAAHMALFGAGVASFLAPCVVPLMPAYVGMMAGEVVAANSADPLEGATLLAAYSLGIGTPFLAAALAVASWPAVLSTLRRWSRRIEPVAGALLVIVGLLLVTGAYTDLLGPLARLMPGAN